jgi:hypothetical protein
MKDAMRSERARRIRVALLIGLASAAYQLVFTHQFPGYRADFDHLHAAAQQVLARNNPYQLIGPGARFDNRFPLYYPLPAVVVLLPFTLAPLVVARVTFVAVAGTLFGYALGSGGGTRWRYLILLSREYRECVILAQWTPLFFAMWCLPALSCLAIVKPTIGSAVVAARGTRSALIWALAGTVGLLGVSFVLQPDWVKWWWMAVRSADHFSVPLGRPGGFLLVLALLRWRRPDARLLFALSIPPQTPGFYDPLLLFLVARTTLEVIVLIAAGWALQFATSFYAPFPSMRAAIAVVGTLSIWFLYVPPLVMVLRRKNAGSVPAWVERLASALPVWLRGSPVSDLAPQFESP